LRPENERTRTFVKSSAAFGGQAVFTPGEKYNKNKEFLGNYQTKSRLYGNKKFLYNSALLV